MLRRVGLWVGKLVQFKREPVAVAEDEEDHDEDQDEGGLFPAPLEDGGAAVLRLQGARRREWTREGVEGRGGPAFDTKANNDNEMATNK